MTPQRHPDVKPATMPPWAPWRFNLGDHWMTVNYLITRSYILREEQLLSRYQHGKDYGPRFAEMLSLINGPERSSVVLVDEPGQQEPDGFDVWTGPAWPTHKRWNARCHKTGYICYQFDGISSAECKNPPEQDLDNILRDIYRSRLSGHMLGMGSTLENVVEHLSVASVFVGVDSGMSHLAHSVGCPVIIVEYGLPVITCHRCKHFLHVRGTDELLAAFKEFV